VQETFSRVLARPRFVRGQDELAYLMQALRNTFLTQQRTAARRPRAGAATLEDVEPMDPRTGDRPEEAQQVREVFSAISELTENHRLALVAVDVAGLSYREAAKALGTREATIATRVFRAREQLAKSLDRDRRAPQPTAPGPASPAQPDPRAPSTQPDLGPRPASASRLGKLTGPGGVFAGEAANDR
jgi:RNA polymerase sigma-70 factor (ECF subfamily)